MSKVIFISEHNITKRDYHRYGMKYLENKGYEVEGWKIKRLFYSKKEISPDAGLYKGKEIFDLSWREFLKKIKENRNAIFILYQYDNFMCMKAMAKYQCVYILIRGTGRILFKGSDNLKVKDIRKNRLMPQSNRQKMQSFFEDRARIYFREHLPKYFFQGVEMHESLTKALPSNRKIYVHSWDYDRYIENGKDENIEEKWIVYVDSGYGNIDWDNYEKGTSNPWQGKGQELWEKLEKAFDKLEEHYHLPVVIAGHPHTKYVEDTLCGRKIILNETPELMCKARLVVMQWSTAISFVTLFRKEILVLIDNDFKMIENWKSYFDANYKYFGITPCNMDIPEMVQEPWKYVYSIDNETARKYIESYIKMPGTPNKLFIEVVEEKIKEIAAQRRKTPKEFANDREMLE